MNNPKILLTGIAVALTAAAEALANFVTELPDDVGGEWLTFNHTTPETIAAASGELDADGLPWDARIHASTKTKTQKGVWTKRKGVQDTVVDAVTAELRQHYPAPNGAAALPPAANGAAVLPQVPAAPPSVNLAPPAPATPYDKLVNFIAKNTGAGKFLTEHWVNDAFEKNSTSLAALAGDMARSQQFYDAFVGTLTANNVAVIE